ncbi:thiamine kinase [Yersinia ruckeri]|uniref:Thiamine kinase n=2 Tax=Yersinia ruckeri TaxID=29486 RepID=A0A0A8VCI8_YERRU|nr:thiamine kinase [Yersinia ruckeri]AKA36984.1 thiamine kinase [Yersinia ruckeri]EKN3345051.1 thiamine kinase [Yersinia ruckeri]EKN4198343.1 thiamine kinase [Yersinia ruckeri]EKN4205156.1 thiamine kinase [Yersinia ruckeri]EKN4687109.1 thiamine kinase [Yersinia ruckeri]
MATYSVEQRLRAWISTLIPADNTAGCHFSPVSGLTGESWRIRGDGIQWLAREQSSAKAQLGVYRQREGRILQKMAARGLAPRRVASNREWLLVEWLDGEVLNEAGFIQIAEQGALATLVVKLHQLPRTGYTLNLRRQLECYGEQMAASRRSANWLRLHRSFLTGSLPKPLKLAPLHMDIHPGNIISTTSGLKLIDWEYAADGDIALELAALFRSNGWQVAQQQRFLQQYCQRPDAYRDTPLLMQQIHNWFTWVDYLMLMWFEVRWQQTGDRAFLHWAAPLRQRFHLPDR